MSSLVPVLNLNEVNSSRFSQNIPEKSSFSWLQRRLFIGRAFNNLHFERTFRMKWRGAQQWQCSPGKEA
jgi:hypothetical protein